MLDWPNLFAAAIQRPMRLIERLLRFVLLVAAIVWVSGSNLSGQPVAEVGLAAPTKVDADEGTRKPTPVTAPVFGYLWRDDLRVVESIVGLPGALSRRWGELRAT